MATMPTATTPEPRLAVIIPHYEDVPRLARCLAALAPQMTPEIELVVVDNGSSASLSPAHDAMPGVRIVTEARKGAALARNRGVEETVAPGLVFLDSDCVPAADWLLTAGITAKRTDGDMFGGRIDVFDETPPPRCGAEAFEAVFAFDWRGYIDRKGFAVTANLVTRRDVFDAVGPFIDGVSEDLEWCHRATRQGFRLRPAPDLKVGHPSRADWPALRKKWLRVTREAYSLEGSRFRARWALKAFAMPLSVLAPSAESSDIAASLGFGRAIACCDNTCPDSSAADDLDAVSGSRTRNLASESEISRSKRKHA